MEWLQDKSEVHISGPGTDLTLNVAGRTWINDDGHLNFPGGEVFTGPHEGATQGTISFNLPGYYQGREVTGVRLRYESGKVVDAGAVGDEEFLLQMLDMDEGARHLGEGGSHRRRRSLFAERRIQGLTHAAPFAVPGNAKASGAVNKIRAPHRAVVSVFPTLLTWARGA
ncbi:MAG: hypothetical protein PVSMB7_27760 [Chloroflexota bacterium]